MIFYIYDKETKEFAGTQNAFIDPLETKKQGKQVYLVPANSTDKKPLEHKENQAVIFNGLEWKVVTDYRGQTYYIGTKSYEMKDIGELPKGATLEPAEPEKTLEELKTDKFNELSIITSHFDNQLVNTDMIINSSLGFKANADLRSQNNIRGLITVGIEPANFVDANNEVQSLTIEQLSTLLNECALNGQSLYLQKWSYKAQIEACNSIEELNAIEFNFTMRDFNNE